MRNYPVKNSIMARAAKPESEKRGFDFAATLKILMFVRKFGIKFPEEYYNQVYPK